MNFPFFGNGRKRKTEVAKRSEAASQMLEEAIAESEATDTRFDREMKEMQDRVKNQKMRIRIEKGGTNG